MAKNVAFFADGTWDGPCQNSNVSRLYSAAAKIDGEQLTTYDPGVGTDGNPVDSILGGAFGVGIFGKIRQGYAAIAAQYAPGDHIFIFGFSRGAYTARSLAGMIAICGLPTINQNDPKCLDMAFEAYRNASQRQMLLDTLNEGYRMDNAKIQLLGVWDTVGSLGIPAIFGGIDVCQYGFLDTSLHPDVLNAVQALAIDEQRLQFQPALWTSAPAPGQSLAQVWFAGVHCDVGGSYPADDGGFALSNITLNWVANYAKNCGLQFAPGAFPSTSRLTDALATLHDSLTGLYSLTPHRRNIVDDSSLYESVQQRCATPASNYAPENLHISGGQLAGGYSIVPYV
jgi:uncharacterized protein (DUF2235 family)